MESGTLKSLTDWTQAGNGVLPHSATRRRLFPWPFSPVGKHPILFLYNFVYLFLAVLGLPSCRGFPLVVVGGGYSLVTAHGLFTVVAFLVAEQGL